MHAFPLMESKYWHDAESTGIPLYGQSAGGPVVLEDVRCAGNESNIANCSTSPIGQISNPACLEPNRIAGVKCSAMEDYCTEGVSRLVDGPTFYEGRVEICSNGRWLSVCDVGLNLTHAITACADHRFHFGGEVNNSNAQTYWLNYSCTFADNVTAIHGSVYGQGTGLQLTFCTIDTGGYTSTQIIPIENCTSNPGLQGLCSHDRDLGVRCQPGLCKQ